MTILLPSKVDEIKRHTNLYLEKRAIIKTEKEQRRVNYIFSVVVVLILGLICFSIWLSIEVGINKRNIWHTSTAGKCLSSAVYAFTYIIILLMQIMALTWFNIVIVHVKAFFSALTYSISTKCKHSLYRTMIIRRSPIHLYYLSRILNYT